MPGPLNAQDDYSWYGPRTIFCRPLPVRDIEMSVMPTSSAVVVLLLDCVLAHYTLQATWAKTRTGLRSTRSSRLPNLWQICVTCLQGPGKGHVKPKNAWKKAVAGTAPLEDSAGGVGRQGQREDAQQRLLPRTKHWRGAVKEKDGRAKQRDREGWRGVVAQTSTRAGLVGLCQAAPGIWPEPGHAALLHLRKSIIPIHLAHSTAAAALARLHVEVQWRELEGAVVHRNKA